MNLTTDGSFHHEFLEMLAKRMRPSCYVELGLWDDPALLHVAKWCDLAIGVDKVGYIGSAPLPSNARIFEMTTNEFFLTEMRKLPRFELVFVDADHRAAAASSDGICIAEHCSENSIICFHDTFPEGPDQAVEGYCADSYKVPGLIPFERVTLPCPPGLTIARVNPMLML